MYKEKIKIKKLYYISKKDKKQYIKDIALLCHVTLYKQRKVLLKNIIKKENPFNYLYLELYF